MPTPRIIEDWQLYHVCGCLSSLVKSGRVVMGGSYPASDWIIDILEGRITRYRAAQIMAWRSLDAFPISEDEALSYLSEMGIEI